MSGRGRARGLLLTREQRHQSDSGRLVGSFSEDDIVHLAHLERSLVGHQSLGDRVLFVSQSFSQRRLDSYQDGPTHNRVEDGQFGDTGHS